MGGRYGCSFWWGGVGCREEDREVEGDYREVGVQNANFGWDSVDGEEQAEFGLFLFDQFQDIGDEDQLPANETAYTGHPGLYQLQEEEKVCKNKVAETRSSTQAGAHLQETLLETVPV